MHPAHHLEYVPRATVERWFNHHLAAYVLILKAKSDRDGFPHQYAVSREKPMTPQFKGLGAELGALKRTIAGYTTELRKDVSKIVTELPQAFDEAKTHIAGAKQALQELKSFNTEMKTGANGDPTSGSESSSEPMKDGQVVTPEPNENQQSAEPQKSWTGEKPQG